MDSEERTHLLRELADGIRRRGLSAPASIALDIVAPLGVLAGQAAMFARPLLPHGRWRSYAAALDSEDGWQELHQLLDDAGR